MFRHIFTKLKELSPFLVLDCRKHNRLFPFISNFILRSRVISLTGRHQVLYMDNARCFNYKCMFEFSDCDKLSPNYKLKILKNYEKINTD